MAESRSRPALHVEFTDVLYGVVIANAIYRLTFGLTVGNAMVLLALAFVVDDWVAYRLSLDEVDPTARNYAVALVLDVLVLVVWYLLTVVPTDSSVPFLLVAAAFFFLAGVWDAALLDVSAVGLLRRSHWQLSIAYLVLAGLGWLSSPPVIAMLAVAAGCFLVRRALVWPDLFSESPNVV